MPDDKILDDAGVSRPGVDLAIVAEQIRLLIQKRVDLPINLVNAGIVTTALWPLYPSWMLLTWLVVFCLVIMARSLIRHHYRNASPGIDNARRWGRVFTVNAFATGCLWGLTGSVILVTPDRTYHVFIVFVLGGMMAGGIVSNSAYMPALLAFMLPTILPVIALLISGGDVTQIEMGVMLAVFAAVLVITGRNINRSIVENFRLRIGQDVLLVKLRASEAAMAEAQRIAHVGSWEFDARLDKSTWSTELYRILGFDPVTSKPSHEMLLARVHPADRAMVARNHGDWTVDDTDRGMDHRIVMDDGAIKWVHETARKTVDAQGRPLRVRGTLQDISERIRAVDALAERDRLLHAVTVGTGILVKTESMEEAMPRALRVLGECMQVDRVMLLKECPNEETPLSVSYSWEAPGIPIHIDTASLVMLSTDRESVIAWRAKLREGQPVIAQLSTSDGPIRALLERAHNKSTLLVPIFVGGTLWGNLGIDACTTAREWTKNEIDTLSIFAGITGRMIYRNEARLLLERSEERFRILSATAQDAIITIDASGRIGTWNVAAERTLGYSTGEAVGKPVHEFLAPARFRAKSDSAMAIFASNGQGAAVDKTTELAARKKDGTEIAIELSLAAARLGGSWEAIGIVRDITARKKAEADLQFANLLLKTQSEASLDGVLIVDAGLKIISFNQRFADIWAVSLKDLAEGDDEAVMQKVASSVQEPEKFVARVRHLYAHPGEDSRDEYRATDGRFIDRYTVTLYTADKRYLGRAWFFRDVSERKQAEALALRMARFDVLTGLANRSVFVEALQHAIAAAKRGEDGFAVIYLDLDHFKDVNDTLGHPIGDGLLKAVADRLRSTTRETDTVARFGGDEFAVVVADTSGPADAAIFADKLIKAFSAAFVIAGNDIYTSASIGIAAYGPDAADAETLLSHADVALYRAKSEGRGGYRFFTDAMDVEVQTRVILGKELRDAVDAGQLFLMYQPQVAIGTGRITGVEALVRWRHPQRGVLGPALFIPIAEQIGIIAKLGSWVLWTACRQAKIWLDAGIAPARMCVNVSALQFRTPIALEADIAAALAQTRLPSHLLELELTESVLMDASREHSDVIQRIRDSGVTVAIDDFGTGYSSLDYLRRFPSNRIKIAQTFVRNVETSSGDASIVKATIGLARELGIMVIAEGVETQKQADLLEKWGCGQVQGFLFAKPLVAEDATVLLRRGSIDKSLALAAV